MPFKKEGNFVGSFSFWNVPNLSKSGLWPQRVGGLEATCLAAGSLRIGTRILLRPIGDEAAVFDL
jgi:hypothetical protein